MRQAVVFIAFKNEHFAVQFREAHIIFRMSDSGESYYSDDSDYDSGDEWETNPRSKRNITNLLSQPLRNPHIKVNIISRAP